VRKLSPEEKERKKAIFESMSARRREHILKKHGYDEWDPFIEPKDPIDMRKDKTKHTALQLTREFLADWDADKYSNEFGQGAWEICLGIINEDDQFKGMYEFACWYRDFLEKQG